MMTTGLSPITNTWSPGSPGIMINNGTNRTDRGNITALKSISLNNDTFTTLTTTLAALDKVASSKQETVVHGVAFASGFTSMFMSIFTLVYIFRRGRGKLFWKRKQGERMVVYLAVSDLSFGAEHMSSHLMNVITGGKPPEVLCEISGFFFQLFMWTQAVVVVICATSAFVLVTWQKKISFGKYDCRLLISVCLFPSIICCIYAFKGYLGPSGYWCYVDMTTDAGMIVHDVNGVVMIIVACVSGLLYLGVWAQISRTKKQLESARGPEDNQSHLPVYQRTARILVCFVVAYLAQWWPMVVYPIWKMYETPHIVMIVLIVLFCNQGGVFNFFAYTFIRRIGRESLSAAMPIRSTSK